MKFPYQIGHQINTNSNSNKMLYPERFSWNILNAWAKLDNAIHAFK